MNGRPNRATIVLAATFWALLVGLGFLGLERYKREPGAEENPAALWPSSSVLPRDPARANLVLTLHPRCPCSDASLAEFARIKAQCRGRGAGRVVFVKPGRTLVGWKRTRLWRAACALPDVGVSCDEGGTEAARFGAETSGQVPLYDASGRLRFRGGITPARGHQGDNAGVQAVVSHLLDAPAVDARTPVFGCPLFHRERC